MKRDVFRLLSFAFVPLLLAAALLLGFSMNWAQANGGTRAVVKNARVGPYELQVGIFPGRPKVGNLHLSILVKDAEAKTLVTDATVMVAVRGPEGATDVSPVQATNTPQSPQFYDVNIPLDVEGSWTLTVETNSYLGKASLDVPLEVTEPGGLDLLFPLAGMVAILTLAVWAWDRTRARRKRQGAQE